MWCQKTKSAWAIMWHCLRDPKIGSFDTIPACDRQTDTHMTTANTTLAVLLCKEAYLIMSLNKLPQN